MTGNEAWPELPVDGWQPTRDTLTLWLQVVGKIRIARTPCSTTGGTLRSTSLLAD